MDNRRHMVQNPDDELIADAVAVDGVWMCTRKEVWEKHQFDEKTFPYFHGYDIDFSRQIFQHFRVCVSFEIIIEHFSIGTFNHAWVKSAIDFSQKWTHGLPARVIGVKVDNEDKKETIALRAFVTRMLSIDYDVRIIWQYLIKCLRREPFARDNFWLTRQFLKRVFKKLFKIK